MYCEDCYLDLCLESVKMDYIKYNWSFIKNIVRIFWKKCMIGLKKVYNIDVVVLEDLYKF